MKECTKKNDEYQHCFLISNAMRKAEGGINNSMVLWKNTGKYYFIFMQSYTNICIYVRVCAHIYVCEYLMMNYTLVVIPFSSKPWLTKSSVPNIETFKLLNWENLEIYKAI